MKPSSLRLARDANIRAKIARLQQGGVPRVLDLFSGCGGLSLGLQSAGFSILGGLDSDPHAARSHALNFHAGCSRHATPQDLTNPGVTPESVCDPLGLGLRLNAVDVVVGGPPCQSFARIGRAKLREIAGDPEAFLKDPRAGLHERWVAWVRELEPLAVLVENVPDALIAGGRNIAEEIALDLDELGFDSRYTLLNTVHSLDARADSDGDAVVRVRIQWLRREDLAELAWLDELLSPLEPHLKAAGRTPGRTEYAALIVEDFGTTGLTGRTDDPGDPGNFRGFFYRHSSSHKGGTAGGRWGLGKLVFARMSVGRAGLA
jgi:hypothetical protein